MQFGRMVYCHLVHNPECVIQDLTPELLRSPLKRFIVTFSDIIPRLSVFVTRLGQEVRGATSAE